MFALVGERIVHAALGPEYEGAAGDEIGRLIVLLGPWMAVSIGVTITFPMLFVANKARRLPLLAIGALLLDVVLTWTAVDAFELDGAALALTVSTLFVLAVLLVLLSPRVLAESGRRLALGAAAIGALALVSFAVPARRAARRRRPPSSASRPSPRCSSPSATVGLQQAWSYLRTLD